MDEREEIRKAIQTAFNVFKVIVVLVLITILIGLATS